MEFPLSLTVSERPGTPPTTCVLWSSPLTARMMPLADACGRFTYALRMLCVCFADALRTLCGRLRTLRGHNATTFGHLPTPRPPTLKREPFCGAFRNMKLDVRHDVAHDPRYNKRQPQTRPETQDRRTEAVRQDKTRNQHESNTKPPKH